MWPPRVADPPTLPFMEEREVPLALDEVTAKPPPEPSFTPSRLAEVREKVERRTGVVSPVLVYDRKNPSGRTRGDAVLNPTNEDRVALVRSRYLRAALTGAQIVFLLALALSPSYLHIAAMAVVGALAGLLARELGSSEQSWALSLGLAGVPVGWIGGMPMVLFCVTVLAAAGWILGLVRDEEMA